MFQDMFDEVPFEDVIFLNVGHDGHKAMFPSYWYFKVMKGPMNSQNIIRNNSA